MQYLTNRTDLSRDNCQKPDFGPNLGLKRHKFGPENFFQPQEHLDIMPVYHNMQQARTIMDPRELKTEYLLLVLVIFSVKTFSKCRARMTLIMG